jgi:hypothetical protein
MDRAAFKERYGNNIQYCCWSNFPWLPVIVAKEKRNAITYCNESKTSNCLIKKYYLVAKDNIPPNTELTLTYNKNYKRDYVL